MSVCGLVAARSCLDMPVAKTAQLAKRWEGTHLKVKVLSAKSFPPALTPSVGRAECRGGCVRPVVVVVVAAAAGAAAAAAAAAVVVVEVTRQRAW